MGTEDMIPPQLRNVPQEVRDAYADTSFNCPECGGDVLPFTMQRGVCFSCKEEFNLSDLDYEVESEAAK